MPLFNAEGELVGVTQLVNKTRQGDFPPYNSADWPEVPECWKASFDRSDLEFMEAFNIQAGVALQNAKLFSTVKQQQHSVNLCIISFANASDPAQVSGTLVIINDSSDEKQKQEQRDLVRRMSSGVIFEEAAGD